MKHNKKRNTAFLFEALVREATKSVVDGDTEKASVIKGLLTEFFGKSKILAKELELYEALYETTGIDLFTAEKLVQASKEEYVKLSQEKIHEQQSKLIGKINRTLGKKLYVNYVPNYRTLATIAQIFNENTPLKSKVLLERNLLKNLVGGREKSGDKDVKLVDNIIYKKFVENYNDEYGELLEEQKNLLKKYIYSFYDSGLEFKIFVDEEVSRIKNTLSESLELQEVKEDQSISNNLYKVIDTIDNLIEEDVTKGFIIKLMKLQKLASEVSV